MPIASFQVAIKVAVTNHFMNLKEKKKNCFKHQQLDDRNKVYSKSGKSISPARHNLHEKKQKNVKKIFFQFLFN